MPRQLHREGSHATRGSVDQDRLAGQQARAAPEYVPGGQSLDEQRQRLAVTHLLRYLDRVGRRDHRGFGVPAALEDRREHPAAVRSTAHDLGAWDERELRSGPVGAVGAVRIRIVDAGRGDLDQEPVC